MRFRPVRIIVCLFIGAAMTVGVAWLYARVIGIRTMLGSPSFRGGTTPAPSNWPFWSVDEESEFVQSWLTKPREHSEFSTERELVVARWSFGIGNDTSALIQEVWGFGFPLPAMWYGSWFRDEKLVDMGWPSFPANGLHGGYHSEFGFKDSLTQMQSQSGFRYPVLPLYFGFTINTLFYAAITYGSWSLFATAIAWRRLSRGKCPTCKYTLGPSPICTECGTKIPGRAS